MRASRLFFSGMFRGFEVSLCGTQDVGNGRCADGAGVGLKCGVGLRLGLIGRRDFWGGRGLT